MDMRSVGSGNTLEVADKINDEELERADALR